MWPFSRRRGSGADVAATPPDAAPAVPPTASASAPAPPAWMDAEPIAPAPALTLTASPTFSAGLTSQRAPLFVEPLTHAVASDAPSGLVSGLATTAPPMSAVEAPLAPQRAPVPVSE